MIKLANIKSRNEAKSVSSKDEFFHNTFYYVCIDGILTFHRAGLDYTGKTVSPKKKQGMIYFAVYVGLSQDLPNGYFEKSEDSDEDTLIYKLY